MIQKQMLRAFADDVVCVTKTPDELRRIIKSFEKLMDKYNLAINKKKTQFVAGRKLREDVKIVEGVERVNDYKYLGVKVT